MTSSLVSPHNDGAKHSLYNLMTRPSSRQKTEREVYGVKIFTCSYVCSCGVSSYACA